MEVVNPTIGVVCNAGEELWVQEFFELFKTPWEFYSSGRTYSTVVSTRTELEGVQAKLLVVYASDPAPSENAHPASPVHTYLKYRDKAFPIYGKVSAITEGGRVLVETSGAFAAAAVEMKYAPMKVIRAGYDLFKEVQILLSSGQPACNARIPTLEIHVEMLRNWILDAGIPVVEVPAVPARYDFIACLTHDVDFMRIRDHRLDHTMCGFVYRASVGSMVKLAKRQISFRHFLKNVKALLSLPAIHLGICEDFWLQDFERFAALERDFKATFFFIPFKNRPGDNVNRRDAWKRGAAYDVTKERGLLAELMQSGNEVGVHAIDAWHDSEKGREEYRRIAETAGKTDLGVRVHWLCFDNASPRKLEEAGFQYDSTFGYNETVGYRAGTAQVFRPEGTHTLLELPLHVQDTALFQESRLGLEESRAWKMCETFLANASTYGGVLTILWHTKSLAPERQWGGFYFRLLEALRSRHAWFATARQAVEWFRKRRAFSFLSVTVSGDRVRLVAECDCPATSDKQPDLRVRIHTPSRKTSRGSDTAKFVDITWTGEPAMEITI